MAQLPASINGKQYFQYNDIWYEVKFAKFSPYSFRNGGGIYWEMQNDIGLKESINRNKARQTYGKEIYCIFKRQLNKKEIRTLGLRDKTL